MYTYYTVINRSETLTSVLFLCKIAIKIVAQCLPSSHHVTYKASTFFIFYVLANCHAPFWVWISSQHFILCAFNVMKHLWEFFNGKFFAHVTYSVTSLSFMSKSFFSFMSINSPSVSSSGCLPRVLQWQHCQHDQLFLL